MLIIYKSVASAFLVRVQRHQLPYWEFKTKVVKIIKEISYKGIQKLLSEGILKNTHRGYVNANGGHVGYCKTVHKHYIQDGYVKKLNDLMNK